MTRWFNTAGPNDPADHSTVPILERLPEVPRLVETRSWFVLHAPRQSGKTTVMRALAAELNASGKYSAIVASCEAGEPFKCDPARASASVIADVRRTAGFMLPPALRPPEPPTRESPAALADDPLAEGLDQLDAYCARLGLDAGTVVVFDARPGSPTDDWNARGSTDTAISPGGRSVLVVRA